MAVAGVGAGLIVLVWGRPKQMVWFLVIRGLCQSDDMIFFQISAKPTSPTGSDANEKQMV